MDDDYELDLKLRYRCSNCKNLESHQAGDKKRKCKKCGTALNEITEKDYLHYKHKQKKSYEEDKKETPPKNKDKDKEKKKKKKSDKTDDNSEDEEPKAKRKLKKNLSTKNIDDKKYKLKKEEDKKSDNKKEKSKKKDKKKKNRHKSIEKLGPIVSNIVSNLFNQKKLEKELEKLDDLNLSELSDLDGATIVVNHDPNNITTVSINNKEMNTDVFDPIFNQFGAIFNENFMNNFRQNFSSSDANYFENIQYIVNNNQQYAKKHKSGPVKDNLLSKLKKFKLTKKYCKKGKDGKLELPNCCICLSEIEKGKEAMLLPCGHIFHSKCCLGWLKDNNTCPMCRFEIK